MNSVPRNAMTLTAASVCGSILRAASTPGKMPIAPTRNKTTSSAWSTAPRGRFGEHYAARHQQRGAEDDLGDGGQHQLTTPDNAMIARTMVASSAREVRPGRDSPRL